jgi:hypothetical protein
MSIPNTAFSSYQASQPSRGRRGAVPAPSLAALAVTSSSLPVPVALAASDPATTAAASESARHNLDRALPSQPERSHFSAAITAPAALPSNPLPTAGAESSEPRDRATAHAVPPPHAAPLPLAVSAGTAAAEPAGVPVGLSIFDEMRAHCSACQRNYKDSEYRIYGKRCFEPVPFYYDSLDKIFHREFREGRVACSMIQVKRALCKSNPCFIDIVAAGFNRDS